MGGAPTPNIPDADAESLSGDTSSGEEESENSAPSLATLSLRSSRQTSPLAMTPVSCREAYLFELEEPSVADTALYERYRDNHSPHNVIFTHHNNINTLPRLNKRRKVIPFYDTIFLRKFPKSNHVWAICSGTCGNIDIHTFLRKISCKKNFLFSHCQVCQTPLHGVYA